MTTKNYHLTITPTSSNTVGKQRAALSAAVLKLQQGKLLYVSNTFTGANTNANRQAAANVSAAQFKKERGSHLRTSNGWAYTIQINRK